MNEEQMTALEQEEIATPDAPAKDPDLILRSGDGKPFESQISAKQSLSRSNKSSNDYEVVPHEYGWAIRKIPESAKRNPPKPNPLAEKYFLVRFHGKSDQNQPNRIVLAVNGEVVNVARRREVVLPERFLEVARHAVIDDFDTQDRGEGDELTPSLQIQMYPFDIIEEFKDAQEGRRQFLNLRMEGTMKTRSNLQQVKAQ